jgi:hypothetical protein
MRLEKAGGWGTARRRREEREEKPERVGWKI